MVKVYDLPGKRFRIFFTPMHWVRFKHTLALDDLGLKLEEGIEIGPFWFSFRWSWHQGPDVTEREWCGTPFTSKADYLLRNVGGALPRVNA